jgi:hypothetical protein
MEPVQRGHLTAREAHSDEEPGAVKPTTTWPRCRRIAVAGPRRPGGWAACEAIQWPDTQRPRPTRSASPSGFQDVETGAAPVPHDIVFSICTQALPTAETQRAAAHSHDHLPLSRSGTTAPKVGPASPGTSGFIAGVGCLGFLASLFPCWCLDMARLLVSPTVLRLLAFEPWHCALAYTRLKKSSHRARSGDPVNGAVAHCAEW